MFLLKLATLNIFRNTKRSILTMTTVFVGVFGFIMASGMVNGVEQTYVRIEIDTETAHLRVMHKRYLSEEENFPLDLLLPQQRAVHSVIKKGWPTALVVPRIIFSAQLGDGEQALGARGVAIDSALAEKAFSLSRYSSSKKPLPETGKWIFVGSIIAKSFKKKIGDTLTIESRTRDGSMNADDYQIAGVISTGNMIIDGGSFYIPLKSARDLLRMPTGLTDVVVKLPKKQDALLVSTRLQKQFGAVQAQTWQDKTRTIFELNKIRRQMFNVLISIILIVAAAGMANTVLMSAFERKGEIGMMMALGMPEGRIVRLFTAEAGMLGLIGSVFGALCGGSWAYYLQVYGWDISAMVEKTYGATGQTTGLSVASFIFFDISFSTILMGIFLGVFVSLLASLWPAWRTTRFDPREVLARS